MDELEKPELTLLQISDLHFGPPYREEAGKAVLRLAGQLPLDAIIVSGDLTQRAKREQFEAARDFLSRLPPVPQLVIPGNHDVPLYRFFERMLTPHRLYQEIISPELNPVLRIGRAIIAGIDSTSPHTAISNGRVFRRQLEACTDLFRNAPSDAIRIVVAHHPFVPAPDCLSDKRVQRAARAMKIFEELNIEMVLGGHLHRAYIGESADFYPAMQRDRSIRVIHSGTTTSRRGRGKEFGRNSLNLIEFRKQTLTVSHFLFRDESQSFTVVSRHIYQRRQQTLLQRWEDSPWPLADRY